MVNCSNRRPLSVNGLNLNLSSTNFWPQSEPIKYNVTLKETLVARSDIVSVKPDLRTCRYELPKVVVPSLTIFSTTSGLDRSCVWAL